MANPEYGTGPYGVGPYGTGRAPMVHTVAGNAQMRIVPYGLLGGLKAIGGRADIVLAPVGTLAKSWAAASPCNAGQWSIAA